jgi:8-oxo-dGTP diphosphatase
MNNLNDSEGLLGCEAVIAAGGVVYRKMDQMFEIILVGNGNPVQWRLPKGIVNKNESLAEAALREVSEETGMAATIDAELGDQEWTYEYDGEPVRKRTTYFLMKYLGGNLENHDQEHEFVTWVELNQSINQLFFASEKSVVRKAAEIVLGRLF